MKKQRQRRLHFYYPFKAISTSRKRWFLDGLIKREKVSGLVQLAIIISFYSSFFSFLIIIYLCFRLKLILKWTGWLFGWFGQVTFHVESQVIRAGETSFAHLAAERFGTGVFAVVARQLVGASEAPLTFRPMATVRFFTWNTFSKSINNQSLIK